MFVMSLWFLLSIAFCITLIIFIIDKFKNKKSKITWKIPTSLFAAGLISLIIGSRLMSNDDNSNNGNDSNTDISTSKSSSENITDNDSSSTEESSQITSSESSSSSSSSSESSEESYEDKINSLNKGSAQYAKYDSSTNTVTWVGYDDWATWKNEELQNIMDILETISNRQAVKYGLHNPAIKVVLPDGTLIAESDGTNDIEFTR